MKRAPHIKQTEKQFRARKRKEFYTVSKAFAAFRFGCAYVPNVSNRVCAIDDLMDTMKNDLKPWWKNA